MKRTRMADIAKALDVSVMTVSNALNDKPDVSASMQKRVLEMAKELNYQPNLVARSMRLNNTKTIGLIISDSSFSFFPNVIKGIENAAAQRDYSILLCNTNGEYHTERNQVKLLASKRVDGLILAASVLESEKDFEYLSSFGIPFVHAIRAPRERETDYVVNDNILGAKIMVEYLLRTGSRDIVFLNLLKSWSSGRQRLEGFMAAHANLDIAPRQDRIFFINHSIDEGYRMTKTLLEDGAAIGTIFCGCDIIAIGAMEAALEMGYRIPEDIRIAGYDDIDLAEYLRVPLTTTRQPKFEIGAQSIKMLVEKISGDKEATAPVILRPELIIRQST